MLEHTTDTAGYTDLVFWLFDLLGMQFSPRLRDIGDRQLYKLKTDTTIYPRLDTRLTGRLDLPRLLEGWDDLARRLSAICDYPAIARVAITAMLTQDVPVLVRILVLPGHIECCHMPTLDVLATLQRDWLFVSVRGQYAPDWQITPGDGALARRPTQEEITAVRDKAQSLGLMLIDSL
jgi:hypothetical protein